MKKLASRVSVELNRHALVILRCALACVLVASVSLWGLAFVSPSSAQAQQSQQSQQYSHSVNVLQSALSDISSEQTNIPVTFADGDSGTPSYDTVGISLYYENPDDPDKPYACSSTAHPPRIYEPLGSMQLYAEVETVSGAIDWAGTLGVGVVWNIEHTYDENGVEIDSDPGIATIDRGSGELRALGQGNGSVVVRCTAQSPYEGYAEASISIEANTGVPYVTDIRICDENGNPYEDDAEIRVESDYFGLEKSFFAAVTYCDPLTGEITRKSTYDGDEIPGLKWSVSGDNKTAYVNEDTGVFIAQDTGSVKLTAYISGAGILGDTVDDYVFVLCGGDTLDA